MSTELRHQWLEVRDCSLADFMEKLEGSFNWDIYRLVTIGRLRDDGILPSWFAAVEKKERPPEYQLVPLKE